MKIMRNLLLVVLLTLCLAFHVSAAEVVETDKCGPSATYTLYDDGLLVIEGTGSISKMPYVGVFSEIEGTITEVVVGDGITEIGDYAFSYGPEKTIKKITFGKGITTFTRHILGQINIPNREYALEEIVLSDGMKTIEQLAFADLVHLKKIDLGNTVETIEPGAFWGCVSLEEVVIPDSVTELAYDAFYECEGLQKVSIGKGVKSLGENMFSVSPMPNLSEVTLSEGLETIGAYAFMNTAIERIVIPNTVTEIGQNAFSGCTKLKSIKLSDNLTEIPSNMVGGCTSLEEIVIPDSVTSICDYAFYDCPAVNKIVIGKGIKTVGQYTFDHSDEGCVTELILSEGLETIGFRAFSGFDIESIVIPDSVTSIGDEAFGGCNDLKNIVIGDGVTSLGNAFYGCPVEKLVIGSGITSLDSTMFSCAYLTEVTLPEGLESIASVSEMGFFQYSKLKSIEIPDSVTSLDEWTFAECKELETVKLGKGITEISANLFWECASLKNVIIPDSVISIGEWAFSGCTSLKNIAFLPESVKYIGDAAFIGCTGLTEIVIPDHIVSLNGNQPLGTAGHGAFAGCTSLKDVQLGKGITFIPYACFINCESLKEIILPDQITAIDSWALSGLKYITYLEIPAGVTYIGGFNFLYDFSFSNIVFKGNAPEMIDLNGICGPDGIVGFYPKNDPSWYDVDAMAFRAGLTALIPYSLDAQGNIIPEVPDSKDIYAELEWFREVKFTDGASYPDNYYYIINGNFLNGYGDEAFAFQLSDAMFGYLPISDKQSVSYAALKMGDILYLNGEACVITEIKKDQVTVAGVDSSETVYYDKILTKAQVETAEAYRTRYGVSPHPGETDPSLDKEIITVPEGVPTEETVYERIISLKETHPEGMPYGLRNHYKLNVHVWIDQTDRVAIEQNGHGCSAFGYLASDTAFGDLPGRYVLSDELAYDSIMVGDNLLGGSHQVVVLEVYKNCLIIAEGNFDGTMHWGRILTREEVTDGYDLLTRYPEGTVAPERAYFEIPCAHDSLEMVNQKDATCTETGYTGDWVCFDCGETFVEGTVIDVYDHNWSDWVITKPATDDTMGEEKRTCKSCGIEETRSSDLTHSFQDVVPGGFYEIPVLWAVEKGITTGKDATHFAPTEACTRAQVVTFLWRAAGEPEPQSMENPFPDVANGKYFTKAVLWAAEQGITGGYKDGTFRPNSTCTRDQIVTFLWRYMGQPEPTATDLSFPDVDPNGFYYKAVLWAAQEGITSGYSDGTFRPSSTCRRDQIVTFLYRAMAQ